MTYAIENNTLPIFPDAFVAQPLSFAMPYFFTSTALHHLPIALNKPGRWFLEIGHYSQIEEELSQCYQTKPDFALAVSSKLALHEAFSGTVSTEIARRFILRDSLCNDLKTCLHEALTNAVIHGNLDLRSCVLSINDFSKFNQIIHERMQQEAYQRKRVRIAAWNTSELLTVTISDEGKRFILDRDHVCNVPTERKSGRGLCIIRSLSEDFWLSDQPKTFHMTFRR